MKIKKILIGITIGIIGLFGLLVIIGLAYYLAWMFMGFTPTDVRILDTLKENEQMLLSIKGVVGAGIARDENNSIIGIAVYVEEHANIQSIPKRLGEFDVFVKKMDEASKVEKREIIIRKNYSHCITYK